MCLAPDRSSTHVSVTATGHVCQLNSLLSHLASVASPVFIILIIRIAAFRLSCGAVDDGEGGKATDDHGYSKHIVSLIYDLTKSGDAGDNRLFEGRRGKSTQDGG
jgi:hypothetical protein